MAGFFDLHLVGLIKNTWEAMASDNAAFRACLPMVEPAVADAWLALLAPGGDASAIAFRVGYGWDLPDRTQVSVTLSDSPSGDQFIGMELGHGEDTVGLLVEETCSIMVWGPNAELLRPLNAVIRAIVMSAVPSLHRAGYANCIYLGGGDLKPEEVMLPEGIYATQQRWQGTSLAVAPGAIYNGKPVIVAAADVQVDGVDGGVSPMEE